MSYSNAEGIKYSCVKYCGWNFQFIKVLLRRKYLSKVTGELAWLR